MTNLPDSARIGARDLAREERLSLTAGDGPWTLPAIPRIGLGAIKMTDGSNGARGDRFHGTTAVCFPAGSSLGAMWNVELARELARALAVESRRKQANMLLGPTINLQRYPLAGRNFETYGEDPVLTGSIARAVVSGLQEEGVAAVPKHFVANDSEIERESVDVRASERALREVYMLPFEMAVRDGGAWALMSAYNRLNGTYCSANRPLLTDVLKTEWGFDGVVVSDWGGVDSTVGSANAGLDIEMPGPADYLGSRLAGALESGDVDEATVDDKAERILRLARRVGAFGRELGAEESVDDAADRALVRRAAAEAFVLLSNDGLLPLERSRISRLAVIGPKAVDTAIQGGGSSHVNPAHEVNVLDGIREAAGPDVEVVFAEGGSIARFAPVLTGRNLTTPDGDRGAILEYFRNGDLVRTETVTSLDLRWIGAPMPGVPMEQTSLRVRATLSVPESGAHRFGLVSAGHATVHLDGELIVDSDDATGGGPHFFGRGTAEVLSSVELEAERAYDLTIDLATRTEKSATAGVVLGLHLPQEEDPISAAAAVARGADAAIVVVGTGGEYEMEGGDRPGLALPGRQPELLAAVIAANPRTVVLVNSGSAVDLAPSASAAAEAFVGYAGQEMGAAIADVLFGDVDPGGRLPFSIPTRGEDGVPLGYDGEGGAGWSGAGGAFDYADEGRIGYRHHEHTGVPARYAFGHGLSYGEAQFEEAEVRADGDGALVSVAVANPGVRSATVVVQIYAKHRGEGEPRRLAGFAKHTIGAGERALIDVAIESRAFRRWSVEDGAWRRVTGAHDIDVATSSATAVWTGTIDIV